MTVVEQRAHRRLPLEFDLSIPSSEPAQTELHLGTTANVSAGGVYLRTNLGNLDSDDILNIRLAVPPTAGVFELGGELATQARVIRVDPAPVRSIPGKPDHKYGIALQFCKPLDIRL